LQHCLALITLFSAILNYVRARVLDFTHIIKLLLILA